MAVIGRRRADQQVAQHQGAVRAQGAQELECPLVGKAVHAAAQGLAIDRDAGPPGSLSFQRGGMLAKGDLKGGRVEPVQGLAERGGRRRPLPAEAAQRLQAR